MVIKVRYVGKINRDLEDALESCLAKFGFAWWGSGYDFRLGVRDLEFDDTKEGG